MKYIFCTLNKGHDDVDDDDCNDDDDGIANKFCTTPCPYSIAHQAKLILFETWFLIEKIQNGNLIILHLSSDVTLWDGDWNIRVNWSLLEH